MPFAICALEVINQVRDAAQQLFDRNQSAATPGAAPDPSQLDTEWPVRMNQPQTDQLHEIDDPQLAATVMMAAAARADRDGAAERREAILACMCHYFQLDTNDAARLLSRADGLADAAPNVLALMHLMAPVVRENCTARECRELLSMLWWVVLAGRQSPPDATAAVTAASRYLGVQPVLTPA